MKQVDFYLLQTAITQGQFKLASRLAKKLQALKKNVLIAVDSASELQQLDSVMWLFSDTSFVAHDCLPADSARSRTHLTQVNDVDSQTLARGYDVFINLCGRVPEFSHNFKRIAELIEPNEPARVIGRNKFKVYKSEGYKLKTHNIAL